MIGGNANLRQVCTERSRPFRTVYPLYRIIRAAATDGIYAAPTEYPVRLLQPQDRGRGMPRPYISTREKAAAFAAAACTMYDNTVIL